MALSDKIRQANSFDFLRFISALFVIISHCYSLTGKEEEELLLVVSNHTYHFSSLGLICFFVISGYLVSQSLFNSPSILNYAWKRFLRIVPGLCGVTLFCLLAVGPVFTGLPLQEYFLNFHTYTYIRNIVFVLPMQWDLPGVFMTNADKGVNGSLWSLILEGRLYILLALLHIFHFFKNRNIAAIVFIALVVASPWFDVLFGRISPFPFYFALHFFAGVIATLYKEKIRHNKWFFLAALVVIIARCFSAAVNPLTFIAFPYTILYLAQLHSAFNRFGRYGDFSYGLFLYGFPIQQCIVAVSGVGISMGLFILLSIVLTLPFAIISWKWIESKALKHKDLIH